MSGPIISVSEVEMSNLRRVENIELAIEGRGNRWSGVRELLEGQKSPLPNFVPEGKMTADTRDWIKEANAETYEPA